MKRRLLAGYSVGSLGTGIFSTVPGVLLLYYMTDILGIPAQYAAWAIFIPKLWDMVSDPLVGFLSDKTKSRWGRRRPYLFVGSWLMPLTFMLVFMTPDFETPLYSFFYILGTFMLAATTYTIFAVPYMTMPAEMSDDPRERTRIISYRMTVALVGILAGGALAPFIVDYFGGGRTGYAYMAVILSAVCFVSMLLTSVCSKYIVLKEQPVQIEPLWSQLKKVVINKPFVGLLSTYLSQLVGVGLFTSLLPYFVVYSLGASQQHVGLLFLVSLGTSTLCIPLWGMLGNKYGKIPTYGLAAVIYAISLACLLLAPSHPYMPYAVMVMLGVGFAGLQVLPYALLTDVIQYDYTLCGVSREGILTGVWTACEKTGLALGPLIAGNILAFSGFVESMSAGQGVSQPETALQGILIGISVVPALLVMSSLLNVKKIKAPHDIIDVRL